MSSLDGNDLFGSGPHTVQPGSWQRQVSRRSFSGVDGEFLLDQGRRSREVRQEGRLQAETAEALEGLVGQIEPFIDGELHVLVDDLGREFPDVIVESFEPAGAVQRGRGFWCDYRVIYRQLP